MNLYDEEVKQKARELREQGFSYTEIQQLLNLPIARGTLTGWFKNVVLSQEAKDRITRLIREGGSPGRAIAWKNNRRRRERRIKNIYRRVNSTIKDLDVASSKLCLAMLYLGEGGKTNEWIRFGNSDPKVITIFLHLLRKCYSLEEEKLRGTVQCRADQNKEYLENFWSNLSGISRSQFYKTLIDRRTIGSPTKRLDYKGVFVVEYFSNALFFELKFVSDIIHKRILDEGP